jgi:DNA-directed RNA polymerase subunit F
MAKKLPKTLIIVCLSFLVFLATCPYAQAQDKKEELKVYQKFFKATNVEAQYNQILNVMIVQLQQGFVVSFRETIKNIGDITPEQKEKLKQLFEQSMGSFVKRMKVKIAEVMPLNELINNVYYPVFSKHFMRLQFARNSFLQRQLSCKNPQQ